MILVGIHTKFTLFFQRNDKLIRSLALADSSKPKKLIQTALRPNDVKHCRADDGWMYVNFPIVRMKKTNNCPIAVPSTASVQQNAIR